SSSTRPTQRGRRWWRGWRHRPSARAQTARGLGAERAGELDEPAHAVARGALAGVGAPETPSRAGDVEVRPRHVADEVGDQRRADDRNRLARFGRVVEVAVGAFDQLVVLLVQGQAPDDLARALAGL